MNSSRTAKVQNDSYFHVRANTENLRAVFNKYASIETEGKHYMTPLDFLVDYLKLFRSENLDDRSLKLLAGVVDTSKDGLISFEEFQAFEKILCLPDALYSTAYRLFDINGTGCIAFEEFKQVCSATTLHERIPFDFNCVFINGHFGKKKDRTINYLEFTQLLHDYHEEHVRQAFFRFDPNGKGYISALDFNKIMILLMNHLLTPWVRTNLVALVLTGDKSNNVNYSYFQAFLSLLNNMETIKKIYLSRTNSNIHATLTKEEILNEAQQYTSITPLEIDILFQIVDIQRKDGRISYREIEEIAPIRDESMTYHAHARHISESIKQQTESFGGFQRSMMLGVFENVYRFLLGSISGACGATAVYPIDLVKTRMQNQRSGSMIGEVMYRNSYDCFKKVVRLEGLIGLYRGLPPQIIGVAPEKAIKLTMNDFIKDLLTSKEDNSIPLTAEVIAGCCAGASQVVFTNPLEIVKIRLQTAGENVGARVSAISVIRELGFKGLYKGAKACFMRDIPFSGIYFPVYQHLKAKFSDVRGYNSPESVFLAATLAGAPAASLTTPFDVIKTRLQVKALAGQTRYHGVVDASRKILREEGPSAFWKGTLARVLRSSPQFGVTLLTYELLQRVLYIDFGGRRPSGSKVADRPEVTLPSHPDHIGGYKLAVQTFDGIESKFGICLPKAKTFQ